jgi:hypothetical protein
MQQMVPPCLFKVKRPHIGPHSDHQQRCCHARSKRSYTGKKIVEDHYMNIYIILQNIKNVIQQQSNKVSLLCPAYRVSALYEHSTFRSCLIIPEFEGFDPSEAS